MRFYDFTCPDGHVTERRAPLGTTAIPCGCGQEAQRVQVNRIGLMVGRQAGVPVAHYLEAAQEAEYRHDRTDDPAAKAATRPDVWRPAKQRAKTRIHEQALGIDDQTTWVDPRPKVSQREVAQGI